AVPATCIPEVPSGLKAKGVHMSSVLSSVSTYSYVLGDKPASFAGLFQFDATADRWEWSEEVYRIHGFEPGEVVPTTALILAHKHPDDRAHFQALLEGVLRDGHPMVSHHRILNGKAKTRYILLVAQPWVEADGSIRGLRGVCIDSTDIRQRETQLVADEAVAKSAEHRATIEQAKGALMYQHGIDADQAFLILSTLSQNTNTKLWAISEEILRQRLHQPVVGV
ncbi:MAG TPA: PAS and ANTAR domain-containing protein, partial [Micrococcaceae bacterium]|nr:PAS and ANTAR domain-containing protein [Micrococcaceae bacterium]